MARKTGRIAMIALILMCAVVCRVSAQNQIPVPAGPGTHIYDNTAQLFVVSLDNDLYVFISTPSPGAGTHIYDSVPMMCLFSVSFGLLTVPVPFAW